jgi:hypothetical protein
MLTSPPLPVVVGPAVAVKSDPTPTFDVPTWILIPPEFSVDAPEDNKIDPDCACAEVPVVTEKLPLDPVAEVSPDFI